MTTNRCGVALPSGLARGCSNRARLLSATALGGSLLFIGSLPAAAAQPANCNVAQFNPLTNTADLLGMACTLPPAAYGLIGNTAAYTITNSLTPQGTLYFGAPETTLNYSGKIVDGAGPVGIVVQGGTNILSGTNNTYSGATIVQGGTLMAGADGAFSPNSATSVMTGGTLDLGGYNQTLKSFQLSGGTIQNGTFTGSVLSTGGTINNVVFTGDLVTTAGSTLIPNNYGYRSTYVGAGSSITYGEGLFVQGIGALNGTGTIIGNVSLSNGATLTPGTVTPAAETPAAVTLATITPGTLTVKGGLNLDAGSIYQVAATPTQASSVTVTGATALGGGTVSVMAVDGTYTNRLYKILSSAGGVTGTFSTVTSNLAFLTPTLTYDANDAYLRLSNNGATIQSVANSSNTSSVAAAIDRSGRETPLGNAFIGLSPQQTQAALNSISGEGNVSSQNIGQQAVHSFSNFLSDRATPSGIGGTGSVEVSSSAGALPAGVAQYAALDTRASPIIVDRPPPQQLWRVFATGFGGGSSLEGQGAGIAGQTGTYYGGLMGVDYRLRPNILIGAAGGGSSSSFLVSSRGSSGNVTGFSGNVFAIATFGAFYGQSLTTLSTFDNQTTRSIAGFGGLSSAVEKANYGSFEARTRAEFGRVVSLEDKYGLSKFGFTNFKVTPFVALEIAQLATNGFSETNAGGGSNVFGLTTQGQTFADVRSFLGGRFESSYDLGHGMILRPTVRLAYIHSFAPAPTFTNSFQSIPNSTFVVQGATIARNAAETKAGAELELGKGRVVFANFDGEFSPIQQVYGGRAGVRISF